MLEGRRRRVIDLFKAGDIEADEKTADLAVITERLLELDVTERAITPRRIDWDEPAEDINGALRALLAPIQLDGSLRPTEPAFLLGRLDPARDA